MAPEYKKLPEYRESEIQTLGGKQHIVGRITFENACRDDILDRMVPSDVRLLVSESETERSRRIVLSEMLQLALDLMSDLLLTSRSCDEYPLLEKRLEVFIEGCTKKLEEINKNG